MPVTSTYEMMYILRSDLTDEQVDQSIAKYESLLRDQGGDQIEIQHRGKRRLAYEIKKQRDGIYIQMNYKAPATHVAPLERAMRLSEEVIRYLTLKLEEPKKETPEPEPAEVEA